MDNNSAIILLILTVFVLLKINFEYQIMTNIIENVKLWEI